MEGMRRTRFKACLLLLGLFVIGTKAAPRPVATTQPPESTSGIADKTSDCNATFTESCGEITSPDADGNYQQCEYFFSAPPGHIVVVVFSSFHLENNQPCASHSVELFDGNVTSVRSSTKLCGMSVSPCPFRSTSENMLIRFVTDGSVVGTGFRFAYYFEDVSPPYDSSSPTPGPSESAIVTAEYYNETSDCTFVFTESCGEIMSPNFTDTYGNNQHCEYYINAPPGQTVVVLFSSFHLEFGSSSCPYDSVKLYDGNTTSDTMIAKLCGNDVGPCPFRSTSENLLVRFDSDQFVVSGGFRLTYHFNGCILGYWGEDCQYQCPRCLNGTACDKNTGACTVGCSGGLKMPSCSYGDCKQGFWSNTCEKRCNCEVSTEFCHISTGYCPSGCKAGYTGPGCEHECIDGKWGVDCLNQCGNCLNGTVCSKSNGECTTGCKPGHRMPFCVDDVCEQGFWGRECEKMCNCDNSTEPCDNYYGMCPFGCKAGYHGFGCSQECDDGRYGVDCQDQCGHCKEDKACDKSTGQCLSGCSTGYEMPMCVKVLSAVDFNVRLVIIVLAVILGITVVAFITVGICFCVWRGRKAKKSGKKEIGLESTDAVKTVQENAYTNMGGPMKNQGPQPVHDDHGVRSSEIYVNAGTLQTSPAVCQGLDKTLGASTDLSKQESSFMEMSYPLTDHEPQPIYGNLGERSSEIYMNTGTLQTSPPVFQDNDETLGVSTDLAQQDNLDEPQEDYVNFQPQH